jgi:hypothetical protein
MASSSNVRIDLKIPVSEATFYAKTLPMNTGPHRSFHNLASYLMSIAGGVYDGKIKEVTGAVNATATITSTGSASNGETASVANQTLTAKTSGAVPANGEFNISGTVGTQAANIALAINSIVALSGVVTATSAAGVVTITASAPGIIGNGLQISESLTNVTATAFAGGVDGHTYTYAIGQA